MSKLSIQNIDLYYGDFKALKNINMEIEENKITAFIGPSPDVVSLHCSNPSTE